MWCWPCSFDPSEEWAEPASGVFGGGGRSSGPDLGWPLPAALAARACLGGAGAGCGLLSALLHLLAPPVPSISLVHWTNPQALLVLPWALCLKRASAAWAPKHTENGETASVGHTGAEL